MGEHHKHAIPTTTRLPGMFIICTALEFREIPESLLCGCSSRPAASHGSWVKNDEFVLKTMNFVSKTRSYVFQMAHFAGAAAAAAAAAVHDGGGVPPARQFWYTNEDSSIEIKILHWFFNRKWGFFYRQKDDFERSRSRWWSRPPAASPVRFPIKSADFPI